MLTEGQMSEQGARLLLPALPPARELLDVGERGIEPCIRPPGHASGRYPTTNYSIGSGIASRIPLAASGSGAASQPDTTDALTPFLSNLHRGKCQLRSCSTRSSPTKHVSRKNEVDAVTGDSIQGRGEPCP